MAKIIEVNNVSKTFGKGENINQVLNGASMSVEQEEFVSLMGASGSGKSTLLYLIGGLDRRFDGNISVCGQDIGSLKDKALSDLRLSITSREKPSTRYSHRMTPLKERSASHRIIHWR